VLRAGAIEVARIAELLQKAGISLSSAELYQP
jgi:hypothetical protein